MIWRQSQCLFQAGNHFAHLTACGINRAEIRMIIRPMWIQCDRAANQFDGGLVMSDLMCDNAQQLQRARVIRVIRENPPVLGFSFRQPPGLMVRDGEVESVQRIHNRLSHGAKYLERFSDFRDDRFPLPRPLLAK